MALRIAINGFGRIGRMVLKAVCRDKGIEVVAILSRNTDVARINAAFKKASRGPLKGILGFSEEPLVSIDFNGNSLSSIVDAPCTRLIGDNMVKVISWYDNETGFSHRLIDLFRLIASKS